jgi:hypothetical protein
MLAVGFVELYADAASWAGFTPPKFETLSAKLP